MNEAMLLTPEEAMALPEGTEVWDEERCTNASYISPMTVTGGWLHADWLDVNLREVLMLNRRIWSAKPTCEQRRTAPW